MALAVGLAKFAIAEWAADWSLWARFLCQVAAGVATYALAMFALYRDRLAEFVSVVRNRGRSAS